MAKVGAPKGNTNGKKENRLITDALRRVVVQNPEKLANACMRILENAEEGNLYALNFIADRLDGKPNQTVDMNVETTPRKADDLTDNELANIATGSRRGTTGKTQGKTELH